MYEGAVPPAPPERRAAWSILGNSQRLDGGAMFGNAPKALWQRWIEPDELNRVPLSCRALLVREPATSSSPFGKTLLFEAGIGAFFEPKLRQRYGVVESEHVLLRSLEAAAGLTHGDIDVVVLSHLHFDHAGGLLAPWREGAAPELLFPNATFVVGERAWERALHPHARDRASFIPELNDLLDESGRLVVVPGDANQHGALGPDFWLHYSDGHTPGLMLTEVVLDGGPLLFGGDLVPGVPWVHLPITMGYDRHPELLIDEKTALLEDLSTRAGRLFYTHDHEIALSAIRRDERGRWSAENPLADEQVCGLQH